MIQFLNRNLMKQSGTINGNSTNSKQYYHLPDKSLDGISLQKGMINEGGCLSHDREYAITDANGKFINGKANPLVHSLRSAIDFEKEMISFRHHDEATWNHFYLEEEKTEIDIYLFALVNTPHDSPSPLFINF